MPAHIFSQFVTILLLCSRCVVATNIVVGTMSHQWTLLGHPQNITACDAILVSAPEYKGNLQSIILSLEMQVT
jgi:hypothetical protein